MTNPGESALSFIRRAFNPIYNGWRSLVYGVDSGSENILKVNSSGEVDVNVITGGGGGTQYTEGTDTIAGGEGTMVLAKNSGGSVGAALNLDSSGDLKVSDAGLTTVTSGSELQVDVVGALPAGTATLGQVSATSRTDAVMTGVTELTPKFASISAASASNEIVALVASKKIRVLAYVLVCGHTSAMTAQWKADGGSDLSGAMTLAPDGGGGTAGYNPVGWFETGAGQALDLDLGTTAQVSGHLTYIEV